MFEVNRISDTCSLIKNELGLDVKLFANDQVSVDRDAFQELFDFLDVERAVRDIHEQAKDFFGDRAGIDKVVLTPDFHKGSGIPVGTVVQTHGFVVPQAIGNDICCGMRLLVTDLPKLLLN